MSKKKEFITRTIRFQEKVSNFIEEVEKKDNRTFNNVVDTVILSFEDIAEQVSGKAGIPKTNLIAIKKEILKHYI